MASRNGANSVTSAEPQTGGMAGAAVEEGVTKKTGLEITVRLDNGQLTAVVQEEGNEIFQAGERVRLLSGAGGTRVTH